MLQVHPEADTEVIEAAYRQLMKKHHPDVAGSDPARVAAHHERSKAINEAFRVLRDPWTRREYDELRHGFSRPRGQRVTPQPPPAPNVPPPTPPPPEPAPVERLKEAASAEKSPWLTPFRLISDAYYLLPGHYEWESGRRGELRSVVLLPIICVLAFSLATGRLSHVVGHDLGAVVLAWGLLALASLPLFQVLPRIALAAVPSLALISGLLTPFLTQAHVPLWLAWPMLGFVSLLLSARLYVFSVLPTVALCWLVTRLTS